MSDLAPEAQMRVLLAGPQGSGKTTQAKLVADQLGLCLIKAGDLIREWITKDTIQAEKWREQINSGQAIDNRVVADLVQIAVAECDDDFIVDGYPRTIDQLKVYDPKYTQVLYLHIPDQVGIKRLIERGRPDDNPSAIEKRLSWYHTETEPLIQYYRDQGLVIDIDATKDIDQVTSDIISALKARSNGTNS